MVDEIVDSAVGRTESPGSTSVTAAGSQVVAATAEMADTLLWPAAQAVDRASSIPRGHFDALADLRLFSMAVPSELGGLGLSSPELRAVLGEVGGGCGATGFVFAQHHGVVGALVRTSNEGLQERWLGRLRDGALAGIVFAHVRRQGPPALRATRGVDGWRIDGRAPWATSWGMAEAFAVAAVSDDGQLVWGLIEGHQADGLIAEEPMSLSVLEATATVRLEFDGLHLPDDDVLRVDDLAAWRQNDRRAAASPSPLCLGIGRRTLSVLAEVDPVVAAASTGRWMDTVARTEEMFAKADRVAAAIAGQTAGVSTEGVDEVIAELAAARADVILEVQRLTNTLLAASGGRGMEVGHPAQLLARQALFYVVQAQNADGRAATLAALGAKAGEQVFD